MEIIGIILEKPVGSGIIGVLCLILILGCIANIDNKSKSGSDSIAVSTEIPDRANVTELHVFEEVGSVYTSQKDIQNAYGTTFSGPYLSIWTLNHKDEELDCYVGYVEYVTGRNYQYLSGTYFAAAKQPPSSELQMLIYADDTLVYSSDLITRETEPIDFTVDIGYCNILRIEMRTDSFYYASSSYSSAEVFLVNTEVYK